MKKLLLFLMVVFSLELSGQKITSLTEATSADTNSLMLVRAGQTGDLLKKIYVKNLIGTANTTELSILDGALITTTELNYLVGVTSNIQTQIDGKEDTTGVAGSELYVELADTIPIVTFGLGSGQAGDTAVFANNALAGAFYNDGSDTLNITQLRAVLASGSGTETIGVQISWSDTLKAVVPVNLNASALTVTSMTVGGSDTSFANAKIPPDKWVWCTISGVSAGNKPSFLNVTLSGYKIPKY